MNFAHIQQGINHALDHLSEITQISNVDIDQDTKCVTWKGRTTGIQRGVYYPFEYQYLLDHQQYSVLLSDASFFQFFYHFNDRGELKAARLAYYPRPVYTIDSQDSLTEAADAALDRDDNLLFEHLFNWVELLETASNRPANTSHIRFDFDVAVQTHSRSHLQFGGVQNFRIPSDFVPQPLAFVQLCEALISSCKTYTQAHISFAKSHSFDLERAAQIISLGTLK